MNKIFQLIVILLMVFVLPVLGVEKMDKYEHWLEEEVPLLLLKGETAEYYGLETDAGKENFIFEFWARRDPTPETEENEFKDEWYRRLVYVNETFTRGQHKGWRSDMGKVYLFFGKPWQTKATPPQKRPDPMGGSQLDLGKQIWVYKQKPEFELNSIFEVTFVDQQWGYDLAEDTPLIIRRALDIYPRTVIVKRAR
jgi:GWxTD domain-containing protein